MMSKKLKYAAADKTRIKILKSARKAFLKQGFAGTSIQEIAKKAGINHSLIFHHFGNKEKLWTEVKASIVDEANTLQTTLPCLDLPFPEFIEALVINSVTFYEQNPDILQLINWQRLTTTKSKSENIGITPSKEMLRWVDAFKHYQDKGDILPTIEPAFIVTLLSTACCQLVIDQNSFIQTEAQKKAYIQFIVSTLQARLHQP